MANDGWTPLRGGNVNAVSRRGATVRRELSAASPAVHGLLRHLQKRGLARVPRFLGSDARYEYLTFLPGEAVFRPWPDAVRGDAWLTDLGGWLRAYGRAAKGFRVHEAEFLWGPAQPSEAMIVCHGDLGPWNLLHRGGRLAGVIDWDLARYGHPLDDAAALALEAVPLHGRHTETLGAEVPHEVLAARLDALCRAYGVPARDILAHLPGYLEEIIRDIYARRRRGDPVRGLRAEGRLRGAGARPGVWARALVLDGPVFTAHPVRLTPFVSPVRCTRRCSLGSSAGRFALKYVSRP